MIKNLIVNDIDVSFIYQTNNIAEAALLRKNLMTKLQCYTIDKITYQKIPTNFTPEKLSGRFGLLIPKQIDTIGYIDVKGPKMVKCKDITNMSFAYNMPLLYLDEHEELKCNLVLKKCCGEVHAKWNSVVACKFTLHDDGFLFKFELTGLLTMDEIIEQMKNF